MNPLLLTDFYKTGHIDQYPENTEMIYSTWTPRTSRIAGVDKVVCFGVQGFIQKYLVDMFKEHFFYSSIDMLVSEYEDVVGNCLDTTINTDHFYELHDLGYLPLEIKSLAEGSRVPIRCPMISVKNTHPDFYWLTNFIETLMSCSLWQPMTSATIAYERKKLLKAFAADTCGEWQSFVNYQAHDFSMRGMSSLESSIVSGAGHLTSFVGTDTIPAVGYLSEYYDAKLDDLAASVPATEHSIQCSYGDDDKYLSKMLEIYHKGIFSIVCDGYDFWKFIAEVLPNHKQEILDRRGKVVIRPDSGDPVKIVCGDLSAKNGSLEYMGAIEALDQIFGSVENKKGYKQLHSKIGLIYGDAITEKRMRAILSGLESKGYASNNVVFGVGSYTYQYNTRDTFGFAMKATMAKIDGNLRPIFKDPATDDGTKKSQKGYVYHYYDKDGELQWYDEAKEEAEKSGAMQTVFKDGKTYNRTNLFDIRERLWGEEW